MFKSIKLSITVFFLFLFTSTSFSKTVVLGFDGMDPKLAEQWMSSGDLPNFKKLAESGHFQPLATSNPAQSPVAWSSFATGLNPGEHGVFDFIHRDPNSFDPVYSISGFKDPETFDLFGWQVPMSQPSIYNKRLGKPFWLTAEQTGSTSSVLRVPVTYPPDNITSMLSGMGVPDLLGTQGTYTFYATKFINKGEKGGNIVRVKVKNDRIETTLDGPPNPFSGNLLSVPLIMQKTDSNSMKITIEDTEINIQEGQWSNWVTVDFSYAGVFSLTGMVRLNLIESFPRVKLYVSPININPQSAELPISNPPEFAKNLSNEIGLFHTLGMPEETWSLNDGLLDSEAYLEMIKTILAEREKMFFKQLSDDSIELLIEVFVQTDRVSHMFWRGHDPNHPTYKDTNEIERNAIKWIYQEADRILGKTMDMLKPDDKLIVLSDHGFAPYYKHVNLNRWLLENNFLSLKTDSNQAFTLKDVDWENTQAYAMGLNGIYLNLQGREKFGSVTKENAPLIEQKIKSQLTTLIDTDNNELIVNRVFLRDEIYSGYESKNSPDLMVGYNRGYRASWQTVLGEAPETLLSINTDMWSGDHCIDPELVPGVLFTNFKPDESNVNGIKNVGSLTLSTLNKKQMLIDENQSGILDVPRDVIMLVLKPLNDNLPPIVATLLTGLIYALIFILVFFILNLIPKIVIFTRLLKLIMSLSLVLIMYDSAKNTFSESHINQNDKVTISVDPIAQNDLNQLKWSNKDNSFIDIKLLEKNKWSYQLNDDEIVLHESDGYELLKLSNNHQNYNKVQKSWYHNILSNHGGYVNQYSQIGNIYVSSETHQNKYWWLWLLAGLILSGIILRKYIK